MRRHSTVSVNISGSHLEAGQGINIIGYHASDTSPNSEKQKVLDWLLEIASVNHHAIQSATYDKLAPDTASWILHEPKFNAWLSQKSGAFWGTGIPGAGKTVLTAFVVNHLQGCASSNGTSETTVFVYCRFDDSLSITKILCALLGQLCENFTTVFSYILEKLYIPCARRNVKPTEKETVTHFFSAIGLAATKLFIVIDALDELRDDVCKKLIDILLASKQSIFLTSRELSIDGLRAPDISIRAPAEDFENFVVHRVRCLPKLWSLLQHRGEVLGELVKEITSKSDGMFLLAALHVFALAGVTTVKSLRSSISALPTTLAEMYQLTLRRIMNQSDEESTLAYRAILWVTYAFRPLKVSELLWALAMEPDSTNLDPDGLTNEKSLISVCCGLLTIEPKTETVRLIHYTTHDFFMSHKEGLLINPHSFAATICVVYMHLFGSVYDAMLTWKNLAEMSKLHPFIEYSCKYVGEHIYHSTTQGTSEISPHVFDLLSKNQYIPLFITGTELHHGSIIHFAALHGLSSTIRAGVQDVNDHSDDGWTPLLYASMGGHSSVVEILLGQAGVDVNAQNLRTQTSLHLSSQRGHESVVRLLLSSQDLIVNAKDTVGTTPLQLAAQNGHQGIVSRLLGYRDIDVNAQDLYGFSALHDASRNGYTEVVRAFLGYQGIDVNAKGAFAQTPLYLASWNNRQGVVRLLLDHKRVDVNARDWHQSTALHCASSSGHESVVQLLLESPRIEINAQDTDGYTPLHHASMNCYEPVVQMLLGSPGIDVNAQNAWGHTALHCASEWGHEEIVKLLLDVPGVDIQIRDRDGLTALHLASKRDQTPVVHLLLGYDEIDINAEDNAGLTALWYASHNGHHSTTQLLLDHPGIDVQSHSQTAGKVVQNTTVEGR